MANVQGVRVPCCMQEPKRRRVRFWLGTGAGVPLEDKGPCPQLRQARISENCPLSTLDVDLHQIHVVILGEQIDYGDLDCPHLVRPGDAGLGQQACGEADRSCTI
jgi:hypothetical protein